MDWDSEPQSSVSHEEMKNSACQEGEALPPSHTASCLQLPFLGSKAQCLFVCLARQLVKAEKTSKGRKTSSHSALSLFLKYAPCCPPPMIEGQGTDLSSSARLHFDFYFYKSSKNILCFLSHLHCLKNYLKLLFIAPFEKPTLVSLCLTRPNKNMMRATEHLIEQAILKSTLRA